MLIWFSSLVQMSNNCEMVNMEFPKNAINFAWVSFSNYHHLVVVYCRKTLKTLPVFKLIDFNGMSNSLGLFYTLIFDTRINFTFIFMFLYSCFISGIYEWFLNMYLAQTCSCQSEPGRNINESIPYTTLISRTGGFSYWMLSSFFF